MPTKASFVEVMQAVRSMLAQLDASELVRTDEKAAKLFAALADARDMEEMSVMIDRFADRVDELIIARGGGVAARLPAKLQRTVATNDMQTALAEGRSFSARRVLRL